MLRKIFKVLAIIALFLLVVGASIFVVYMMDWPYWTAALLPLGLLASVMVVGLLRKVWIRCRAWWVRWREMRSATGITPEIKATLKRLDESWKLVVRKLRRSRIQRGGSAVQSLPWYLMIGGDGAGKSSALENCRIAMPVLGEQSEAQQTAECSWWFLNEAVMVDTPGRYVNQRGEGDRLEWRRFLNLFERYRRAEPLNGVVVAVSAEQLLSGDSQQIENVAKDLRARIDEAMQSLGVRFPVYLLVTKCDLIGGMSKFFTCFPDPVMSQAMGLVNENAELPHSGTSFAEQLVGKVYRNLCQLRLSVFGELKKSEINADILLFPEEFQKLQGPLGTFFGVLLDRRGYRDAPLFRGTFFASAHQEGAAISHYRSSLGFSQIPATRKPGERSFFLRDLFSKIIEQDECLYAPATTALRLRRFTRNSGLIAWVVLCIFGGVGLSVSFYQNNLALQDVLQELPPSVDLNQHFGDDLKMLSQYRQAILALEHRNQDWWTPRLGLSQSIEAKQRLTLGYNRRFRQSALTAHARELEVSIASLHVDSSPNYIARHIDYLTSRIKLLREAVNAERSQESLELIGLPTYSLFGWASNQGDPALVDLMKQNYLSYLAWEVNPRILEEELSEVSALLLTLLTNKEIGLDWLPNWANLQDHLPDIEGKSYWGEATTWGTGQVLKVEKAFTPAGWQAIEQFMVDIEAAVPDAGFMAESRLRFEKDYRQAYFNAWQGFVSNFHRGALSWKERGKRIELVGKFASKDSPYAKLLSALPDYLQPAVDLSKDQDAIPAWVQTTYRFDNFADASYQKTLQGGEVLAKEVARTGGRTLSRLKRVLRGFEGGDEDAVSRQDAKALPHYKGYFQTLEEMADKVRAPQAAYQVVNETFGDADITAGEPKHAVAKNYWEQRSLRQILDTGQTDEDIFWKLLGYQTTFVWGVLLDESQRYLQQVWETEVIEAASGLGGWQKIEAMQGQAGSVWEFQKTYLGPSLKNTRAKGYLSRVLYDDSLGFSSAFLRVLNKGRVGSGAITGVYRVQIDALPTGANTGATVKPHKARLVLECGSGNQALTNLNYPIRETFAWSPQDCGDVVLEIYVGDIVLEKKYRGYNAFVSFLQDFRTGRKLINRSDYPEFSAQLAGYGIEQIAIGYAFSGHNNVLSLALKDPSRIPEKIFN